jgi:UDPglucose 6-dehydrogenase
MARNSSRETATSAIWKIKENNERTLQCEAVGTDASFFIPPSSSLPDGSFTNEFLLRARQPIAAAVRENGKCGHLFVCNSTTTPGAVDRVLKPMLEREMGGICGNDFGLSDNPEFVALGNVVNGLLEPDMVLIGESDPESGAALEQVYKKFNPNSPHIARMSIVSAELAKISLNSYIAMKISFTNQLRMIADRFPGADIHAILEAIGSDSRIGQKYLGDLATLQQRDDIKLAVICCPWPQYLKVKFAPGIKVFSPWKL